MEYEFHLQDPRSPDPEYLFEAIIAEVEYACYWRAMFAFASVAGVESLMLDPVVATYLGREAEVDLVVGLDAITNRPTLARLVDLERAHPTLRPRVFWNRSGGLFHPKLSYFRRGDGTQSLIVGSGNLTPGGLRENIEAFSVMRCSAEEHLELSSWDEFLERHADDVRAIDDEALERAARNVIRGGRRRQRRLAVEPDVDVPEVEPEDAGDVATTRFLVARVPRAGNRWHQVHFNRDVVEQFLRVRPNSPQRAYMTSVAGDGTRGEQEVRPCIYSQSNKNFKVEMRARHGTPYPAQGEPLVVMKELQPRTFDYVMLMPGEPGHAQMRQLTDDLPKVGRGARRVITNGATIQERWPGCPLL